MFENTRRSVVSALTSLLLPKRSMSTGAFDGAGFTRRTRAMITSGQGPNSLLASNGDELRRRSRATVRNNAWAANALEAFESSCIGTGIRPQPKHPRQEVNDLLSRLFERWTDESDAAGISDFYGQQSLVCRETMEAGEVLVRLRPRKLDDGLTVPLQLQIIESEHLPFNKNETLENGNIIRNGIEFNGIGKRVAYYLYKEHPGELSGLPNGPELIRVKAEFVIHVFKPIRGGGHRGQPWLTQVMVRLDELDKYEDAELLRKQFAAMITHVITENNPEDQVNLGSEDTADEDGIPVEQIQPGSTLKLHAGEDIKISQPADVGANYSEFLMWNLYAIAAGIGITFEMLTGYLKGVSFSSIRAGLNEFERRCEKIQHQVMVFQFNRVVWKAFLDAAALAGTINAAEYAKHPEWYLDVTWQPPRRKYVNPVQDVEAEKEMVRNGFKAQSDVINSLGENPDRVRRQIADDNKANDALGLKFDSDGRNSLKAPTAAPTPTDTGLNARVRQPQTNDSGAIQ